MIDQVPERGAQAVYDALDGLGIAYQRFSHPPVFTVDQAVEHWQGIDATHCKNLFLRNKKGSKHYLVVVDHRKAVDLRALAERVGDDRLSFGSPERLQRLLGLTPGSVSPFGVLHDSACAVNVVVDADLRRSERVAFHPNVNTVTIALSFVDFERFLQAVAHPPRYVAL